VVMTRLLLRSAEAFLSSDRVPATACVTRGSQMPGGAAWNSRPGSVRVATAHHSFHHRLPERASAKPGSGWRSGQFPKQPFGEAELLEGIGLALDVVESMN